MWPREISRGPRDSLRRRWESLSTLACPSCGESGRAAFEDRGHDEASGDRILRCVGCLSGVMVTTRRGLPRGRPRLIDPHTWSQMETAWAREPVQAANTAPEPIEDPEALVMALREQGFGGETLTHLVAETLEKSPVEAALLIAEASGGSVA